MTTLWPSFPMTGVALLRRWGGRADISYYDYFSAGAEPV